MKSYLSLVPISAKVHKRQSRMTRICIILAVFLVTSIFSMVEMWTKAETTAMRHNHGDWHIALQNIQDNEAEQIRKDNDVAFSSWYDSINANAEQDYYIGGKNAVIYGIEEAYSTNIMNYPTEGNYPQNEKEVVLSADAKELFGVKVGDSITLNRLNVGDKIKIGDTEIEIACIASEGVGSVSGAATMVCSEETYTQLTGEQDYALVSVVLEKNISETEVSKIRNLSSDYVFADNRAENSDVNGSYWVFRLAAYGFLAIISFITILNIMNSISMSVSARIKQYGAMRAVGMGNFRRLPPCLLWYSIIPMSFIN